MLRISQRLPLDRLCFFLIIEASRCERVIANFYSILQIVRMNLKKDIILASFKFRTPLRPLLILRRKNQEPSTVNHFLLQFINLRVDRVSLQFSLTFKQSGQYVCADSAPNFSSRPFPVYYICTWPLQCLCGILLLLVFCFITSSGFFLIRRTQRQNNLN